MNNDGWNQETGTTDHAQAQRYMQSLSVAQLYYVKKDAREARDAMPEGQKAGHYADLVHYALMELKRR